MKELKIDYVYKELYDNPKDISYDSEKKFEYISEQIVNSYNADNTCIKWINDTRSTGYRPVTNLNYSKSKKHSIREIALFSELQEILGIDEYQYKGMRDIFASNPLCSLAVAYVKWFSKDDTGLETVHIQKKTYEYIKRCLLLLHSNEMWKPNNTEITAFINDIFDDIGYGDIEDCKNKHQENDIVDFQERIAICLEQELLESDIDMKDDLLEQKEYIRESLGELFIGTYNEAVSLKGLINGETKKSNDSIRENVCLLDVIQKYVLGVTSNRVPWKISNSLDLLISILQRFPMENPFLLRSITVASEIMITKIKMNTPDACMGNELLDETLIKYQVMYEFFSRIRQQREDEEGLRRQYTSFVQSIIKLLSGSGEKTLKSNTGYYIEQIYAPFFIGCVYQYAIKNTVFCNMIQSEDSLCRERVIKTFARNMALIIKSCVRVNTRIAIAFYVIDKYYNDQNLYWIAAEKYSANYYNNMEFFGFGLDSKELSNEIIKDIEEHCLESFCTVEATIYDIVNELESNNGVGIGEGDEPNIGTSNGLKVICKQDWYKWYMNQENKTKAENNKLFDALDNSYLRYLIGNMYEYKIIVPLMK